MNRQAIAALALLACACARAPKPPPDEGLQLADVIVTSRGADPGGEFCSDFALDAGQASAFFSRAQVIDARHYHDEFDYLPCFVRGSARHARGTAKWEIRAGGTGTLELPDGRVLLLGCQQCGDLLGGAPQ